MIVDDRSHSEKDLRFTRLFEFVDFDCSNNWALAAKGGKEMAFLLTGWGQFRKRNLNFQVSDGFRIHVDQAQEYSLIDLNVVWFVDRNQAHVLRPGKVSTLYDLTMFCDVYAIHRRSVQSFATMDTSESLSLFLSKLDRAANGSCVHVSSR